MTERRIGRLDTPDKCTRECELVYRLAWKGKIGWPEAQGAAAVLERLSKMIAGKGDQDQREAEWIDVGKNAVRG